LKTVRLLTKVCFYIVFLLLILNSVLFCAENNRIYKVNIIGNERIEKDAIYPFISTKPGDSFNDANIKKDIEAIYRMGFFENVLVNYNKTDKGVEITFIVFEKPYVKMVYFKGIKKLKKADVTKDLKTKSFTILNEDNIKQDADKIRDNYQEKGYYGVKVTYQITKPVNHKVTVTFNIIEGKKSKIDNVKFIGNKHISSRTIRKSIYTREYSWWLSWMTGTGYLKKSELDKDVKRIENLYHTNGYVRVKVFEPVVKLKDNGKYLDVIFKIEEGKVYKFGKIDVVDKELSEKKYKWLLKHLRCKKGKHFNNMSIHKDINSLTDYYADMGYAFADISPKSLIFDDNLTVNVTFFVDRGNLFKFRDISIEGNTYTRDKVIRRELRFYEQDNYTSSGLKRSRGNLKRTGYFSEVDITTKKVSDNEIDAKVSVKETPTGSLSFGGGYSSSESFILTGQISQNNLFGKGYKLKLDAALSGITQRYNISFTDPAILDTDLSFGVSFFNIDYEYDNYDTLKKGFGLTLGKRVTDFVRWDANYYYETVKVYNVDDDAADYIKDEEGKTSISSLGFSISKDTRDDYYYPMEGVKQRIYAEINGSFLGGDEDFYKIIAQSVWFVPLSRKNKVVFDFRAKIGYIGEIGGSTIPAWERFYVGGIDSIRGFKHGEAGPRDESNDVKGGTKEIVTNTEINFPIVRDIGVNGVVFFDMGRAFDKDESISLDLRKSVGVGLRWRSPFGLIRIEWGYNLSPKYDEKSSVWGFSMGTMF